MNIIRKPGPYTWGYADSKGGLGLEENPYAVGTQAYEKWRIGWIDAKLKKDKD